MPAVRDIALIEASVPAAATLREAARALAAANVGAIAVVEGERVVGLFTQDDLVRALFPRYLAELHHSAFLKDDTEALRRSASDLDAPVFGSMQDPVVVEADASASHAAERFLHVEAGAIAVVENDAFRGMLTQLELVRSLAKELGIEP